MNSELRELYKLDDKLIWSDQKNDIITKLLPLLYKLVNKKYKNKFSNIDLLKMLYGHWHSRHWVNNIEIQGDDQVKKQKKSSKKHVNAGSK